MQIVFGSRAFLESVRAKTQQPSCLASKTKTQFAIESRLTCKVDTLSIIAQGPAVKRLFGLNAPFETWGRFENSNLAYSEAKNREIVSIHDRISSSGSRSRSKSTVI